MVNNSANNPCNKDSDATKELVKFSRRKLLEDEDYFIQRGKEKQIR